MKRTPSERLMNATLQALRQLGGSGSNQEIHDNVVDILGLSDDEIEEPYQHGNSSPTRLGKRLGWERTWLKRYGLLENSSRGVWALTARGQATSKVDHKEVDRVVKEQIRQEKEAVEGAGDTDSDDSIDLLSDTDDSALEEAWRAELNDLLLKMDPSAFERLFQRILRESGFTQVDVTGRSGDGGIDGIGVMRIGGFLSFKVLFQCKRYKGSIGAGVIRDFRGAMVGRTDKGLIVTTGSFTPAATREATRDGAPEIDLVDGEQLIDKLKELGLGVRTEQVTVERVVIDTDWFGGV